MAGPPQIVVVRQQVQTPHPAPTQGLKHGAVQLHLQKQRKPASASLGKERYVAPAATRHVATRSKPRFRTPATDFLMTFISLISVYVFSLRAHPGVPVARLTNGRAGRSLGPSRPGRRGTPGPAQEQLQVQELLTQQGSFSSTQQGACDGSQFPSNG